MKRVFLSLPMSGRTDEEIREQIKEMKFIVGKYYVENGNINETISFVNGLDVCGNMPIIPKHKIVTEPLRYLGRDIEELSYCDAVVFGTNWDEARGCLVECYVAYKYGIPSYYIYGDTICHLDGSSKFIIDDRGVLYDELQF